MTFIKTTLLIVDDEPLSLDLLANILHEEYEIFVAANGESALKILSKKRPDIIILDINMPDINGFELTKMILSDAQNKNIPIIYLSANDSFEYMQRGFDLGGSDYLTKPVNPKFLKLKMKFYANFVQKMRENESNQQLLNEYKNTVDRSSIVSKTNTKGIITYVNERFCELSGYTAEELIGKSHNIVRHPDMPSPVFKELWQSVQAGKSWFGIVKNRKKDGTSYYVDTVINPILDSHNNIIEYIGMRHDITELETYKQLLKEELSTTSKSLEENLNYMKQYESAINSVTAVLKTNTDNIITYANEKFCELTNYNLEEILGRNCSEIRDDIHRFNDDCEKIREELKNKKTIVKLLTNRTKAGDKLYTSTLFFPITDIYGNIIEHLQVMHDVTDIIKLNEEIVDTQKEVVMTMGAIGETRSKETGQHVKRVAEYSYLLAKLYGMSEEKASLLKQASPMHDIGKVGIPDDILNKPGKLTNEEFEIIKMHSELGYEMLKHSKREILKTAATIAYTHHEKYDGSGYPNALLGEEIPIEGRITALADVFDALGHDRVYKKAWPLEEILDLFTKERAKHFDPNLIDLFFANLDKFLAIKAKLEG